MQIIPAIYILDGNTVALYKGDLDQKDIYRKTPLQFAQEFVEQGAKTLYLVDLNATLKQEVIHIDLLKEIRDNVEIELIYGGGIRSMETLDFVFDMGMNRCVLGVAAQEIYAEAISKYGNEKIIVGIRAKDMEVVTDIETKYPIRVIDFAEKLPEKGVKQVLYKDIMKEGTQIHPNYDVIDRLLNMTDLKIYASSGIGKMKHLKLLKELGVNGAIIGKAFYEGVLNVSESINEFEVS